MQVDMQAGKWGGRLIAFFLVSIAVFVIGAIVLSEVFGVDLESAIAPVAAEIDLSGRQVLYLFVGTTFAVLGLATAIGRGFPALGRAVSLARDDPVPVGELHLESGAVEVEGTAEPMDAYGTVGAPYSGAECL